jgi:hypothetical protein
MAIGYGMLGRHQMTVCECVEVYYYAASSCHSSNVAYDRM